MKLISKIHDYYDAPFKQSVSDPKYCFVRHNETIHIKQTAVHSTRLAFMKFSCDVGGVSYYFEGGLIGFCGTIYPYISRSVTHYTTYVPPKSEFYYTWDDFVRNNPEIAAGKGRVSNKCYINNLSDIKNWLATGTVCNWVSDYVSTTDQEILRLFRDYRVAYFQISRIDNNNKERFVVVELYPVLGNYSFYKLFDTYSTYQRVEMFLMNELIRPDVINVVIPDELKAQSKGFNKWSFRKMSEKVK
jgi:hypothetical protein